MSIHQPRRQNVGIEEGLAYDVLRGDDGRVIVVNMSEVEMNLILSAKHGDRAANAEFWTGGEATKIIAGLTTEMATSFKIAA